MAPQIKQTLNISIKQKFMKYINIIIIFYIYMYFSLLICFL